MDIIVIVGAVAFAFLLAFVMGKKGGFLRSAAMVWPVPIGILAGAAATLGLPGASRFLVLAVAFVLDILFGVAVLAVWFYRDPERTPPRDSGAILAPADGKIKYIRKIECGSFPFSEKNGRVIRLTEFMGTDSVPETGYIIGIVMSVLDVHVNRAPAAGTITFVRHTPGFYLSLKKFEAFVQNERAAFVIDTGGFSVGVVMIASRIVRKIVEYKQEGDRVGAGERIGMIKFGSQTDLIVPATVIINVSEGEQVYAGKSVICTYAPEKII
jgi:phosphatidylserine decarboxylase